MGLGEVVARGEAHLGWVSRVPDVVEDLLGPLERAGIGHRQHRLHEGLAVDLVHPPARLGLHSAPLAQRIVAVGHADEQRGQPFDALADGGYQVRFRDGPVDLLVRQLQHRGGGDDEREREHAASLTARRGTRQRLASVAPAGSPSIRPRVACDAL